MMLTEIIPAVLPLHLSGNKIAAAFYAEGALKHSPVASKSRRDLVESKFDQSLAVNIRFVNECMIP